MSNPTKIFSSITEANRVLPLNSPKKLLLNGRSFCMVRTEERIYVMDNICPHNRASLSEGRINAYNEIICPLHEYRYDLLTGRESLLRCKDLETFQLRIEDAGIFLVI